MFARNLWPWLVAALLGLAGCGAGAPASGSDVAGGPDGVVSGPDGANDAATSDAAAADVSPPRDVAADVGRDASRADIELDTGPDSETPDAGPADVAPDTGAPPIERPYDELPVAACGMPSYELIDPDELGEVLAFEPLPFWDLTADVLNALLATTGFELMELPYGVKLWRMRYTTQDRGRKVEATSIVGVPRGEGIGAEPLPIALHLHGTTGFVDECAPSHPEADEIMLAPLALFAAMGYVLVAPDYIGMNGFGDPATVRHAYLGGEQVAIGSWDAVRAARRALEALPTPFPTQPRVVPWGASQGGHAALFAEHYAPYYAPEFDVPAVVALVPALDLFPLWQHSTASLMASSGLFTVSLATMYEWYGRQASLADVLTNEEPYFLADHAVEAVYPEGHCRIEFAADVSSVEEVFPAESIARIAAGDWEALAPWSCYYGESSLLRSSVPRRRLTPTLTVFAEGDVLIPPTALVDAFGALCDAGWRLDYLECAGAGHTDGTVWSLPEQFEWVARRIAGDPIPAETLCRIQPPVRCSLTPDAGK